ncbi:polysaccharide biosynthesis C-terminal domain-containing protein [Halorubrum sp. CBA1229]|uniref:oligosaccharide flippase family protein n=1 Tax=Halorubrum sp. CBA1229 TaxID=1853699 RepID=UPI000F419D6A|nr:polysaccharide biosynthesis C-terminal domain-containing protein [Halorubrum sp. CBA1229]QKY15563.1 polysaccharide biosynthesis C-terminal domain-containing protein [Halorubrum sp. CBA1229]
MIDFLSKIVMSFSGFVATIVLTRTLGQERYGAYVVVLSVLAWVAIAGNLGLSPAIKKRVSEADDGNYVVSGAIVQLILYAIVAICLWIARPYLNAYMEIDATAILILLLAVKLATDFIQSVLDGQHLVHISSLLSPIEWTSRSVVQIALVLSGLGVVGAFAGYVVGALVAVVIGVYFASFDPSLPSRRDFDRLRSYAQFSWLASVKGRTFLSMDTLVLAVFVSNSVIAVYEIAWNLASLFAIFGSSVSRTLFPEMSKISSAEGASDEIAELFRISLAYSGLFIIPGLIGAAIVGDVVLTIYGSGFQTGYYILLILTFARLLYGYQGQFLTVLDGVNRPDLTFRINGVFVAVNLVLNILLTWQYGWYGAAAATTASAALGLVFGYYYTSRIIDVVVPIDVVGKQLSAAGVMALVVYVGRLLFGETLSVVLILVVTGVGVYFTVLMAISPEFRTTVEENLPFNVSLLKKRLT